MREIFDRLKISGLEDSIIHEISGKRLFSELKSEFYNDAQEVAQYSNLKFYKAHLEEHIKMVVSRSIEATKIISKISGVSCNMKDITIASLYHDTGMNGNYRNSKRYSPKDGDGIRKNHSLTSAVHVLDKNKIEALGDNPDKITAIVYLHSKSNSSVRVFTNSYDYKLESALAILNTETKRYELEFKREKLGNLTQLKIEEAKRTQIIYISPNGERIQITDNNDKEYFTHMYRMDKVIYHQCI